MVLVRGTKYRFKNQPDTPDLMYIGKQYYGCWHRFTKYKEGQFGKVWSELISSDLHMLEEVRQ